MWAQGVCFIIATALSVFPSHALWKKPGNEAWGPQAPGSQTVSPWEGVFADLFEMTEPKPVYNVHTRLTAQAPMKGEKYDGEGMICRSDSRLEPISQEEMKKRLLVAASVNSTRWKMYTTRPVVESWASWNNHCGSCRQETQKRPVPQGKRPSGKLEVTKIFYVNPTYSKRRHSAMIKMLKERSNGIPFEQFRATTRLEAQSADLSEYSSKGTSQDLVDKYGEDNIHTPIASFISQYRMLQHILETDPEGEGVYLILEDDTMLDRDWKGKVDKLLTTLVPEDWDLLKLGRPSWSTLRCQDKINKYIYEARTPDHNEKINFYAGLYGYLVRPKSVPKILQQLSESPITDFESAMMSKYKDGEYERAGKTFYWNWGARTYVTTFPLVGAFEGEVELLI